MAMCRCPFAHSHLTRNWEPFLNAHPAEKATQLFFLFKKLRTGTLLYIKLLLKIVLVSVASKYSVSLSLCSVSGFWTDMLFLYSSVVIEMWFLRTYTSKQTNKQASKQSSKQKSLKLRFYSTTTTTWFIIPYANVASYIRYLFFRVVHPATDVLFLRYSLLFL
jgi:hypothetical protein